MAKYIKKPIEIEAIQFNGFDKTTGYILLSERPKWFTQEMELDVLIFEKENFIIIKTLEGEMKALEGDFIIKGVNQELYPCKPDVFEKTYEKVE